jgi:threonine synthase
MGKSGSKGITTQNAETEASLAPAVRCNSCGQPYPIASMPYSCASCGGLYDYDGPPNLQAGDFRVSLPGLWRFRNTFGLPEGAPTISLGEGQTPLIPLKDNNRTVWLKLESLNPTGSYKDRGSAVLLSYLAARGAGQAVEDSSGNAGASFAAYAARANVRARVFVPEAASGPKRGQIEAYGAELIRVPGPRSAAAEAVLQEARAGTVYASHAYLPFGLPGIATIAYELWEQMAGGRVGTIIAPVGHGGLLLGLLRGFEALKVGGMMEKLPYFVGVQAQACAPVAAAFQEGIAALASAEEGPTIAEGVRVRQPARADAILGFLQQDFPGSGVIVAVPEDEILPAYQQLAACGVHVEPTSALVWAAYQKLSGEIPEPVVLILTGSGLKYSPTI